MTGRRHPHPHRRRKLSAERGPLAGGERLDSVLRGLQGDSSSGAPDVCGKVLTRLGYRPASRPEAAWETLRRVGRRAGTVFCVLILIGVGLYTIDATRREQAHDHRVDDLLRASVRERGAWLDDVVEGLRPVSRIPSALLQPSSEPTAGLGEESDGVLVPVPAVEPRPERNDPPAERAAAPFRQA